HAAQGRVRGTAAAGHVVRISNRFSKSNLRSNARYIDATDGGERKMGTAGDVLEETTPLSDALRRLWADHVIWTRQYIVAALAGSPDAEAAAGRLLRNQEDIGNAIVPLYGAEAGQELTRLLKEHILIAVDLVAAAAKGDKRAFARHDKRWDANADDLAAFLAGANPNWPEDDVRDLLAQHLSLTKGEVVARLQKDWAADVAAFDDIFTEILTMADALTDGIVAQFPGSFGVDGRTPAAPDGTGHGAAGAQRKTHFRSSLALT